MIFGLSYMMEKVASFHYHYPGRFISKDLKDTMGRFSDILSPGGTFTECSLITSDVRPPRVDFTPRLRFSVLRSLDPPRLISLETLIFRA